LRQEVLKTPSEGKALFRGAEVFLGACRWDGLSVASDTVTLEQEASNRYPFCKGRINRACEKGAPTRLKGSTP
jgi:hypothetical protein